MKKSKIALLVICFTLLLSPMASLAHSRPHHGPHHSMKHHRPHMAPPPRHHFHHMPMHPPIIHHYPRYYSHYTQYYGGIDFGFTRHIPIYTHGGFGAGFHISI